MKIKILADEQIKFNENDLSIERNNDEFALVEMSTGMILATGTKSELLNYKTTIVRTKDHETKKIYFQPRLSMDFDEGTKNYEFREA